MGVGKFLKLIGSENITFWMGETRYSAELFEYVKAEEPDFEIK